MPVLDNDAFESFGAPEAAQAPKTLSQDEFESAGAPEQPTSFGEQATKLAKGVGRGIAGFAGDMGEAVMGPFGPSHHFANLMADLGYGERPKEEPTYGAQLSKAVGIEDKKPGYAGTIGEFLGNPTTYVGPGGMLAKGLMGAASGAGSEFAGQQLEGTGYEGVGRIGGALLGGPLAGRIVSPALSAEQAMLSDRGVHMTPGQLGGKLPSRFEEAAQSIPAVGHFIETGRVRSIGDFNRAIGNEALGQIGESLDRGTRGGHGMVREVERKLDDQYNQLIPNLVMHPDATFTQDIRNIRQSLDELPPAQQAQFNAILRNRLLAPNRWQVQQPGGGPPITTTFLRGSDFKNIESELKTIARRYGKSQDVAQQMMSDKIHDVVGAMRGALERSNPGFQGQLQPLNRAWAIYSRIRGAASRRTTSGGLFTPNDYLAAIKRGDSSVGNGMFAKGDALTQPLAEAAQNILPSKTPDSGTPARLMTAAALHGGFGSALSFLNPKYLAAIAGSAAAYSRPATSAYRLYSRTPRTAIGRGMRAYSEAGRGSVPIGPGDYALAGQALRSAMQANPFANPDGQ